MFGTPLPDLQQHPAMMQSVQHVFELLRDCIVRMELETQPELDALFVLSTMHGVASMLHTQSLNSISLTEAVLDQSVQHALSQLKIALKAERPPQ